MNPSIRNFHPLRTAPPQRARYGLWPIALGVVTLAAALPAHALPLISEVFYDAVGSDDGQSFIEISGVPGQSLEGYTLEGVNGSNGAVAPVISLTGTIGASGLFVVADSRSDGTSDVALADLFANFDLQNGPDSVVLTDGLSVIDALGYGVFGAGEIFAGEGAPAADPAAGFSLARLYADLDTDDNALDFVALDVPTPGVATFQAVPEPGSGALAYAGLFAIAWMRRTVARQATRSPR